MGLGFLHSESLKVPMEYPPITASFGPIDRLILRLQSLEGSNSKYTMPVGFSANQIGSLIKHLKEFLDPLKSSSEMEDTSFMAKWWIKEIRELCYDTEDYLDEVTMQYGAGARWRLGNLGRIASIFVHWIYSKLRCRRPPLSQFLARAEVLKRRCPASLDNENIADDISLNKEIKADDISLDEGNRSDIKTLATQLVELLRLDDDEKARLKVVAISGCAGAGKTALASTVYLKYKRKFQCRAFVRVSRNPDFRSLLTSILSQVKAPPPPPQDFPDVQGLIAGISKHLQQKRYFIVIDDVRRTSVWDIIRRAFPVDRRGSRIIITTQSEHVASACSGYELESTIFQMDAVNSCTDTTSEEKNEVLNLRYNNLPLHLETCMLYLSMYLEGCTITKDDLVKQWVAEGFVAAQKRRRTEEISEVPQYKTEEISEVPQNETHEISEAPQDQINEIEEAPKYEKGEIEEVPQDKRVERAEVPQKETEQIAAGYFDELVTRGMIQSVNRNHKGEVLSCTVHHMVLDLIRYKSKEDNFMVVVDNLESTVGHPDIVRRLSVQFGSEKGASMPESIILSQVRSLAFCGFLECAPSVADYGLLQVLILNVWADEDKIFDLTRIGELYHLRYLKIECNITVTLPSKIRGLQHLGTLELHAKVVADGIPWDIVHLEKLLHLRLPRESILPHGVGRMTSLRTLGYFDLGSNSEENVRSLDELKNLQDLQLTCSTGEPAENLEKNMQLLLGSVLQKLSMLQSVTLVPASGSCKGNAQPDYGAVSSMNISSDGFSSMFPVPAHHLQRLELSRHCCIFSRLPKWLGELTQLCILKIAVKELTKEDIDILEGLPALAVLSLHVASAAAERIVFGKGGFSVLTYVKFTCTVPWLKFEAGAMPNLQKLRLGFNGPIADVQGIIIEHLPSIEEISALIGCAGVDMGSTLLKAIRNDPNNPEVQLIGSIYYGDKGRGMVTHEESGKDKNNKAHSRIQTVQQPSSLSDPVRSREEESEHGHSIPEIISIPFESKNTDEHTGQAEEGATETKKLCNTTKAIENLEFGASIVAFGAIMIVPWSFLYLSDRGVHNQRYIIPLLLGFTCLISGSCLMLLSMNLFEIPENLVSERQRMVSKYLSLLCNTLPGAKTIVSPLLLSGYKLNRYIGLALLVVVTAPLALVMYVGLKAKGGDKEVAFKEHREKLEAAFKFFNNSGIGGVVALVVNYNETGHFGKNKSDVLVAIFFVVTISIWGILSREICAKVINSPRLRGCIIKSPVQKRPLVPVGKGL